MTQNPALCNLGHDTIDKTKLLTFSGVIVRDPVGNKYMTAASHGFPHGPAVFHPSGKERMISNIVMGLTHKCWDSPVAWWCWIRERNFLRVLMMKYMPCSLFIFVFSLIAMAFLLLALNISHLYWYLMDMDVHLMDRIDYVHWGSLQWHREIWECIVIPEDDSPIWWFCMISIAVQQINNYLGLLYSYGGFQAEPYQVWLCPF